MKKIGALALLCCIAFSGILLSSAAKAAPYYIGVVTGTAAMSEDALSGALAAIEKYGKVESGGMIKYIQYPDSFGWEVETVIERILGLANDPLMKAIVVCQGVPGTAEAFARIRERRLDIKLYVASPHEDPAIIQAAADLVVEPDFLARGYTIPWAAKKMGATTFVHISFKRHMSYSSLSKRRDLMKLACLSLGLRFVEEQAVDPTTDVGVSGAQQFIIEAVPKWIKKYGKDTAFFCTNDVHAEPLIMSLLKYGGYFVESDLPAPGLGYSGALGIDLSELTGKYAEMTKKTEREVVAAGGAGRFGTWMYPFEYAATLGLVEHAIRVQEGKAKPADARAALDAFEACTPGCAWNGQWLVDTSTGIEAKNHLLTYEDTYVFGAGYLGSAKVEVPKLSPLMKQ